METTVEGVEKVQNQAFDAISHSVRRDIIKYLHENVEVSYTELLRALRIETGHLNFHLRKLRKFIERTENDTYVLSPLGKKCYEAITLLEQNNLTAGRVMTGQLHLRRRVLAFLIDALVLFFSFGLFLDLKTYALIGYFLGNFTHLLVMNFGGFFEHLTEIAYATVSHYSHVFFAVFIVFTALEAYRGQTLGKYLMKIRVVKVSGGKISPMESVIRNLGKVFLLPVDLLTGVVLYHKRGFLRFFDHYTDIRVERL